MLLMCLALVMQAPDLDIDSSLQSQDIAFAVMKHIIATSSGASEQISYPCLFI